MAAVKQEFDYNFERFDTPVGGARTSAARAAAVPAQNPQVRQPLQKVPKSREEQIRYRERTTLRKMFTIVTLAALFMAVFSIHINAGLKQYQISREIEQVEAQIEAARSERVRLNYELDGITSIGNIDEYATVRLGMSKAESYQVEYIDLGEDAGVLYYSHGGFLDSLFNR